jgi:hypothetical protein
MTIGIMHNPNIGKGSLDELVRSLGIAQAGPLSKMAQTIALARCCNRFRSNCLTNNKSWLQ